MYVEVIVASLAILAVLGKQRLSKITLALALVSMGAYGCALIHVHLMTLLGGHYDSLIYVESSIGDIAFILASISVIFDEARARTENKDSRQQITD